MIKTLLLPVSLLLTLAACTPKESSSATTEGVVQSADTLMTVDSHNSRNSLDWYGLYKGIVPCADCEGIETILILNADSSYLLKTTYLGVPDAIPTEKTGTLSWNAEGNTIILHGLENAPTMYFVEENKLIQLDLAGHKIEGQLADKYMLIKS